MRITIERLRTLVLVAAGLLVVALAVFLSVGRWKSHLTIGEIPKRLGVDIEKEANGVTYTQSRSGHTLFKIHASKVVQLKQDGRALLHDVHIELYGEDGSRVDTIDGKEFEYDQKNGRATAGGPVEITLTRPGTGTPAVASELNGKKPGTKLSKPDALDAAAKSAAAGEIHVKTSGLTFDQKSGTATTSQRVEFSIAQGSGSSIGANFDSQSGQLVLDHAVELSLERGGKPMAIHAAHADFERGDMLCHLRAATADFDRGTAKAGAAQVLFREDGSAVRLNATEGFQVSSKNGETVSAARAVLDFGEDNQPQRGRLEGGVALQSLDRSGRVVHGSAPTADLNFSDQGELRHVHLERGVSMHSEQTIALAAGRGDQKTVRDWTSPVADVELRSAAKGQSEVSSIHGTGGVTISAQTQRGGGPLLPSRLTADQVTANFGEHQQLQDVAGIGHARLEQTNAAGTHQTTSGDRVTARFGAGKGETASSQIQGATVEGNVVLTSQPAPKPGSPEPALMRAFAGHAVYEGTGEWLHLSDHPRVEDGTLQLAADRVDVSQTAGDAFAHGDVKATWTNSGGAQQGKAGSGGSGSGNLTFGAQGPAHIVADEAQVHQATSEITFRGNARLWQQANSVTAPVIVLDRIKQTLVARTTSASDPVRLVMVTQSGMGTSARQKSSQAGSAVPVVRVSAGDLKYSDAERKAVLHAGVAGTVNAETENVSTASNEVQLILLPPGNHAGKDGSSTQVDRLIATGHVVLRSSGRRGTGEQLVYSSETESYRLTGTSAAPPKITDPARGMVTGDALIFNSRDDSVVVEGQGQKTVTETSVPR